MALSLAEQLQIVDDAIERTLQAQSSTAPDGRSKTNLRLDELRQMKEDLELRIRFATGGRVRALEVAD